MANLWCKRCHDNADATEVPLGVVVQLIITKAQKAPYKHATIFCPDCPKGRALVCDSCAVREHAAGTHEEFHSLEAIIREHSPVWLFIPVLDSILLTLCAYYICTAMKFDESDYLHGDHICPTVRKIRGLLFWIDASATTAFMNFGTIPGFCNVEDGYWRFFIDTWVRCIFTSSDTLLLLLSTLPRLLIFHFTVMKYLLRPLLVMLYALMCSVILLLGAALPIPSAENIPGHKALAMIYNFGAQGMPPRTCARERPQINALEGAAYRLSRKVRVFRFFFEHTRGRVDVYFALAVILCLLLRLCCLYTGLDRLLRFIFVSENQTNRFGGLAPHANSDSSDAMVRGIVHALLFNIVPILLKVLLCVSVLLVPLVLKVFRETKAFLQAMPRPPAPTAQNTMHWRLPCAVVQGPSCGDQPREGPGPGKGPAPGGLALAGPALGSTARDRSPGARLAQAR